MYVDYTCGYQHNCLGIPVTGHLTVLLYQPCPQSPPASFDMTSPAKLVRRTRLGRLAINGKFKKAELGSDFGEILLDLKTASGKGWNTFTIVCQQWQSRLGDFAFKERSIDKIDVDFGAQQLVPSEELQEYAPLTVTGDGSCLFRALSVLVFSDETKSVEFPIRCVIELA